MLKYALSLLTSTLRHRYSIATVFILRCKGIDKAFILRFKGMDPVLVRYAKGMITICVKRIRAGRRRKITLLLVISFFIPPGVPLHQIMVTRADPSTIDRCNLLYRTLFVPWSVSKDHNQVRQVTN